MMFLKLMKIPARFRAEVHGAAGAFEDTDVRLEHQIEGTRFGEFLLPHFGQAILLSTIICDFLEILAGGMTLSFSSEGDRRGSVHGTPCGQAGRRNCSRDPEACHADSDGFEARPRPGGTGTGFHQRFLMCAWVRRHYGP